MNEYKHEKLVRNFLRSKHIPIDYINYDNVEIYSRVKQFINQSYIAETDQRLFDKFCRTWVINKGILKTKYLAKIQAKLEYYSNRLYNNTMRTRRLQRRAQKKTV